MPKGVPNKKYTPEFKKLVVVTMQEEKLGYSRHSSQQIRVIYRDIGIIDSDMLAEEEQPHILPPVNECVRKLA